MLNKQERLSLYEKALSDYRKPGTDNYRFFGLCYYFSKVHNIVDIYHHLAELLPELEKASLLTREEAAYWYTDGAKAPRIRCLKEAIKILKQSKS